MKAFKGDWVEIKLQLLSPKARNDRLPDDTKKVPLVAYIEGFLLNDSEVGKHAQIKTSIGRIHEGTLSDAKPRYLHDFGRPIKELLPIGTEIRKLLAD